MTLPPLSLLLRRLASRPGYTLAAVVTLALGLGANLTIFSLVRGVLLRPLPFPDEGRLVAPFSVQQGDRETSSPPDFADFRSRAHSLSGLAAYYYDALTFNGDRGSEQVAAAYVTADFFRVLGVRPRLGRTFTTDELQPDNRSGARIVGAGPEASRVVVLSHGLWARRFGADPSVVGHSVRVGGQRWSVAGVMPPSFDFPRGSEAWVPLAFDSETLSTQRGAHFLRLVGRLRQGIPLAAAEAELRGIAGSLAKLYPDTNDGGSAELVPLREAIVGRVRPQLLMLQWAVGLVLLMAAANVASLMLARVLERRREVALRTALGASRTSLLGDVLGESLLLGGTAAVAGVALASWVVGGLRGIASLPLPRLAEVRIDGLVVLGGVAGAAAVSALVALMPALRMASRRDLAGALEGGGRSGDDRRGLRLRGGLIVGESAIALVLLFGATLVGRSFLNLSRVEPGFAPRGALTFTLALPAGQYPQPADRRQVTERLLGRLQAIPGVRSAGAALALPMSRDTQDYVVDKLDGALAFSKPADAPSVVVQVVSPGYLRALGVAVQRGRDFTAADRLDSPVVCLVDPGAAALLWPRRDPLGHTLDIGTRFGQGGPHAGGEVVGVVGRVRQYGLADEAPPTVYVAHAQFPIESYGVVVRSPRPPQSLEREVRAALRQVDPTLAAANVRPLASFLADNTAEARLHATLLGLFGLAAVLLAAVGLYGLMSFAALQSRREVAIRMALGSDRGAVLRRLLRRGMVLGGGGLALGLAAALPLGNVLRRWLYGLPPQDPWSAGAAIALLLGVVVAASLVPAWRAAGVDPATTLRQ